MGRIPGTRYPWMSVSASGTRTRAKPTFRCEYPGCTNAFTAKRSLWRHEVLKHGRKKRKDETIIVYPPYMTGQGTAGGRDGAPMNVYSGTIGNERQSTGTVGNDGGMVGSDATGMETRNEKGTAATQPESESIVIAESPESHDASLQSHDVSLQSHDASLQSHDASLQSHDVSLQSHDASSQKSVKSESVIAEAENKSQRTSDEPEDSVTEDIMSLVEKVKQESEQENDSVTGGEREMSEMHELSSMELTLDDLIQIDDQDE